MDAAQVSVCGLKVWGLSPARAWLARNWGPVLLLLALVVGLGLRWPVLIANPFHEDEALYSTWARRVADGSDPWLERAWVDKPPLHLYTMAGLFCLLGPSRVAARLPGLAAGLASLVCLYGLARRQYGLWTAVLAAWLLALSPFHISLSGTAFTDPMMVLWVVAALWAVAARRWGVAGLALGLAASTKQHGLFFVPLVLALAWLAWEEREAVARSRLKPVVLLPAAGTLGVGVLRASAGQRALPAARSLALLVAGFALPMGLTTWWDAHRWALRPSYFERSLTAYGGVKLASLSALPERLADWGALAGYLGASAWANGFLAASAVLVLVVAVRCAGKGTRRAWVDLLWLGFGGGYFALHCLVNFQPWDRYLLPLTPLVSLVAARGMSLAWSWTRARGLWRPWGAVLALLLVLGHPAALAAASRLPLGADHGAYDGMEAVGGWLSRHGEPGVPVYHRWLGWHLGYYLYGTAVDHRWYPDAGALAEAVGRSGGGYLAAPGWHSLAQERMSLAQAGYRLEVQVRAWGRVPSCALTVYRVVPGRVPALAREGGPTW